VNERIVNVALLVRVQRVTWYLFLVLFAVACVLLILGNSWAEIAGVTCIVLILLATALRLIVLFELFRRATLFRHALLCVLLLVILVSVIILKRFGL